MQNRKSPEKDSNWLKLRIQGTEIKWKTWHEFLRILYMNYELCEFHVLSVIESLGCKLFSYEFSVIWGDAVLRTEPAVQVDFATYGLLLKQSFKEMSKVTFSDTFIHNLLQPYWYFCFDLIVLLFFCSPFHHISLSKVVLLTPLNEGLFIINSLGAPGWEGVLWNTNSLHLDQSDILRFRDFKENYLKFTDDF